MRLELCLICMSESQNTQNDQNGQTAAELEAQLKRALADYQNLQKRFDKEKEDVVKFANQVLLMKILGVLEGFEMVMKQFGDLLAQEGFEKVSIKEGAKFDANLMEAIDGEGDKVETIYSHPYKLHDKVVRHGRVKVRV